MKQNGKFKNLFIFCGKSFIIVLCKNLVFTFIFRIVCQSALIVTLLLLRAVRLMKRFYGRVIFVTLTGHQRIPSAAFFSVAERRL